MKFKPCTGKCTEEGTKCEGCGRGHEEIAEFNTLIKALTNFAERMEYENPAEFSEGVASAVKYKMGLGH